jgi:hypothetical protein
MSACVTTGIGAFVMSGVGEPRWSGFLRAQGAFPLKVSKAGAALFNVPADYTEIDLLTGAPPALKE